PGATTQDPQGLKAWERGGFCDNRLRDDDGRGGVLPFCDTLLRGKDGSSINRHLRPFATPAFAGKATVV
nr:hypothetical protein [Endozoicomonas sp.]